MSAESTVCLGQSVVYFSVNLGVRCDVTPQVIELMDCFQVSSTDCDVGRVILFLRCRLVKDPSLLQADHEPKSWAASSKQEVRYCKALSVWATRTALVSEEEVTEQLLKCDCMGMQSPEFKQITIKTVADVNSTDIVKIFYDMFKDYAGRLPMV